MDKRNTEVPDEHHKPVTGEWLPQDHRQHQKWLSGISDHVDENPKEIHGVLKEFKTMVQSSSKLTMLASSMFSEVPKKRPYNKSVDENQVVRDLDHLLAILNHILSTGPEWTENAHRVGVVGVPINAVLDYNMATTSGFAFFLDEEVNRSIKKILDVWGAFLKTEESAKCLEGWLSNATTLATVANKASSTDKTFEELFICNPSAKYHGYKSWDDFFTRPLREGVRPIASPDDDNVIANACESKPYKVQHDVKLRDKFWIKGQPYSTIDMLDHDESAHEFVGGTVYQAFLSALSYHRCHDLTVSFIPEANKFTGGTLRFLARSLKLGSFLVHITASHNSRTLLKRTAIDCVQEKNHTDSLNLDMEQINEAKLHLKDICLQSQRAR